MKSLLLLSIFLFVASGCMNPLVLRRAQTLPVGQVEVVASPAMIINRGKVEQTFTPAFTYSEVGDSFFPTLSLRIGVFKNTDVQLKLDPLLFPEVNVALNLYDSGPRLSVMAGMKWASFGEGPGKARLLFVPLTLLLDIPFEQWVLYGAFGITPGLSFFESGPSMILQPRIALGIWVPLGQHFFFAPEVVVQQTLGGPRSAKAVGNTVMALALGLGVSF